jgi:hypothetical protein
MVAVRFVGEVFDRTGSYDLAFKAFMAGALLSILLIWLVRRSGAGAAQPLPMAAAAGE